MVRAGWRCGNVAVETGSWRDAQEGYVPKRALAHAWQPALGVADAPGRGGGPGRHAVTAPRLMARVVIMASRRLLDGAPAHLVRHHFEVQLVVYDCVEYASQ
jgi:hypothetical protein